LLQNRPDLQQAAPVEGPDLAGRLDGGGLHVLAAGVLGQGVGGLFTAPAHFSPSEHGGCPNGRSARPRDAEARGPSRPRQWGPILGGPHAGGAAKSPRVGAKCWGETLNNRN
jgi:hypothetical protein